LAAATPKTAAEAATPSSQPRRRHPMSSVKPARTSKVFSNSTPESGAVLTPDRSTNRARGAKCPTVACNRAVSTHQPFVVSTFAAP
jgi:hypothetical protein